MPEPSETIAAVESDPQTRHEFVLRRYDRAIQYYWRSSGRNKRAFKWIRLATIVLGSVVTLLASLSSSDIFTTHSSWRTAFGIGTPLLAGLLTVLSALAQTFQWEASWRESVMTAERLTKEFDRIRVSKPDPTSSTLSRSSTA